MWKSPLDTKRPEGADHQFAPALLLGFLHDLDEILLEQVNREASEPFPVFMELSGPYREVPPRIAMWEAIKVIEHMVSPGPAPVPNALSDCIVFCMGMLMLHGGQRAEECSECEDGCPAGDRYAASFEPHYLEPTNALRRLAGKKRALRSLKHLTEKEWQTIIERVFMPNRDWALALHDRFPDLLANKNGCRDEAGIHPGYFSPPLREPTQAEWDAALHRFTNILDWAETSPGLLPASELIVT